MWFYNFVHLSAELLRRLWPWQRGMRSRRESRWSPGYGHPNLEVGTRDHVLSPKTCMLREETKV